MNSNWLFSLFVYNDARRGYHSEGWFPYDRKDRRAACAVSFPILAVIEKPALKFILQLHFPTDVSISKN